jgi:hypothetical protein
VVELVDMEVAVEVVQVQAEMVQMVESRLLGHKYF